jgi:hypothetical protein
MYPRPATDGGLAQSLVEPHALANGELERTFLPTVLGAISEGANSANLVAPQIIESLG